MKKTYINPNMEVVKIATLSILCGSLDPINGTGSITEERVTSGTAGEGRDSDADWDD